MFLGANNNIPQADFGFVDDSLDSALGAFTEEDIELLSQALPMKVNTKTDCDSNTTKHTRGAPPKTPAKCSHRDIELKRLEAIAKLEAKKSSPEKVEHRQAKHISPVKCPPEEIERKRLEALAKLAKKNHAPAPPKEESPIKCSPEEIQLKRREALAKLEAKKKQDVIERNRLAALEKLKMKQQRKTVARRLIP